MNAMRSAAVLLFNVWVWTSSCSCSEDVARRVRSSSEVVDGLKEERASTQREVTALEQSVLKTRQELDKVGAEIDGLREEIRALSDGATVELPGLYGEEGQLLRARVTNADERMESWPDSHRNSVVYTPHD